MGNLDALVATAREARERAYCPYSGYAVGAAVLGADGKVYTGCNVENASYGLTMCAERTAILAMVAAGCRSIREAVVATQDSGTPCGACRQVMSEFIESPEDVLVHCVDDSGGIRSLRFSELLPHAFRLGRDRG